MKLITSSWHEERISCAEAQYESLISSDLFYKIERADNNATLFSQWHYVPHSFLCANQR